MKIKVKMPVTARAGHIAHTTGGGVHKNKAKNGKGNRSSKIRKAIREAVRGH
tara:strand:- start:480 stop:635 length:156 start_codon:yes stop_codon:yes gene_type:complete